MAGPILTGDAGTTAKADARPGYLLLITFVAAMGGLLFGYDWVVIGGAAKFYEAHFALRDVAAALPADAGPWARMLADFNSPTGWAQSCALLGCLGGALASGWAGDRFGRKPMLILAALIFLVSSLGIAVAGDMNAFILWRILGGVAIGLASNISPMYIAEIAPAEKRGMLVAVNQLTIVVGILLAQIVNACIAREVPAELAVENAKLSADGFKALAATWNATDGWRWMFGACAVPSALFLTGALIVPESPRWLVKAGRDAKAVEVLAKIGGERYAAEANREIVASLDDASAGRGLWRELLRPRVLTVLGIGVSLAVLQQWCGINVIFNYAEKIFASAGFETNSALVNMVGTGAVNLLFTLVALVTVDKWGRKPLMLFGFASLTVIYLVVGQCFAMNDATPHAVNPYVFLGLVLGAIGCYAMSLAPVTWVLISEIFPNRIRGAAMSVAVGALWMACFVLTYTFPIMKERLGVAGTFRVYALICAVGFAFILFFLRETKGRSLEQIESDN